ncbi:hypothetical protein Pmani_002629 [Petrolisthes manimaculis]|uniref:Uncharacterized protein n=1 Tax=Petrolisthes manimaculis TaxID=1843537 RepID=A0AAE1UJ78_9EUCA|nr:hypothetical protein Pmani_002629 [Petrolisthes manimaculis]
MDEEEEEEEDDDEEEEEEEEEESALGEKKKKEEEEETIELSDMTFDRDRIVVLEGHARVREIRPTSLTEQDAVDQRLSRLVSAGYDMLLFAVVF